MPSSIYQSKPVAIAYIGGISMPIVSLECTYQLNEIPSADIVVPGGRELTSAGLGNLTPAYYFNPAADVIIPASVVINNKVLIYGYVKSAQFSQSANDASSYAHISISHWLGLLEFWTLFNPRHVSTNPIGLILYNKAVNETKLKTPLVNAFRDLWVTTKNWIRFLASEEPFILDEQKVPDKKRRRAIDLLDFITSPIKLSLEHCKKNIQSAVQENVFFDFLGNAFDDKGLSQFASGFSLWSKLINGFLPDFRLMLVPTTTRAYIVPDAASTDPYATIGPEDHLSSVVGTQFQQPLELVGVYKDYPKSIFGGEAQQVVAMPSAIGVFAAPKFGVWRFFPAPLFIRQYETTEIQIPQFAEAKKIWPNAFKRRRKWETVAQAAMRRARALGKERVDAATLYAASLYDAVLFSGRGANLIVKPTIIYAPGTTLAVQASYGAWPWLGRIAATKIHIDDKSSIFTVSYIMQYCRTFQEHSAIGIYASPLYRMPWFGSTIWGDIWAPDEEKKMKEIIGEDKKQQAGK